MTSSTEAYIPKVSGLRKRGADQQIAHEVVNVITVLQEELASVAKEIENSVLGVCGNFRSMSVRARDAVATAAAILSDDQARGVDRIKAGLEALLARLGEACDSSKQQCQVFSELEIRLDLAARVGEKIVEFAREAEQDLMEAFLPIRRSAQRHGSMDMVWSELTAVTRTGQSVGNQLRAMAASLRGMAKECGTRTRSAAELDNATIETTRRALTTILEAILESYERMNDSLSCSAEMSSQLNMDIGQSVMSLQFQDRINQRIDHIVSTMQELHSDLHPLAACGYRLEGPTITDVWMRRHQEKATSGATGSYCASSVDSSIELF